MELTISNYKIYSVVLDLFRLDGGAMFGSVPKPLWEKDFPADEKNRIQLCARSLILEGNGRKILLDTGCGPLWTEKEKGMFHIESSYSESLSKLLPDITDVVQLICISIMLVELVLNLRRKLCLPSLMRGIGLVERTWSERRHRDLERELVIEVLS